MTGSAPDSAAIDEADLAVLRDSIASVLDSECTSNALHAFVDGNSALARDLGRHATELGWLAVGVPEAIGGFGMGDAGACLINQQLGRVVAPVAVLSSLVAAQVLAAAANPEALDLAQRVVAGEASVAIPAAMSHCTPLRGGEVSGAFVLLGDITATHALVVLDTGAVGLVELRAGDVHARDIWDRTRTVMDAELSSRACIVLVGGAVDLKLAFERHYAIAVAADCIGLGRGIADKTIAYMKERSQFGRVIGSFQALKHRMVDMIAKLEIAAHVVAQAVEAAQAGDDMAGMWALLAKASASEAAVFVAGDCVQLHGGVGFTWEYDVHLYLKRARLNEVLVGDNRALRDIAQLRLAHATRAGRSSLELA